MSWCLYLWILTSSLVLQSLIPLHPLKMPVSINCNFLHSMNVLSTTSIWSFFLIVLIHVYSPSSPFQTHAYRNHPLFWFCMLKDGTDVPNFFYWWVKLEVLLKWMMDVLLSKLWTCIVGEDPSCWRVGNIPIETRIAQLDDVTWDPRFLFHDTFKFLRRGCTMRWHTLGEELISFSLHALNSIFHVNV